MNERIKKLANLCYENGPIGKDGWPEYSKFNEEKFAELIIRECAELSVNSQYANTRSEYYEGFNEALVYVGNKIKQHFGVEE